MRVFVTGSEGFVGKELISQCERLGIDTVMVDMVEKSQKNYHRFDIKSKEIAEIIPEQADAVIHLAGLTRDPDCKDKAYECFESNVMATLNLINAAQSRKVKQFIFASSEWVYGPFKEGEIKNEDTIIDISVLTSEYALSKLVSEANLRQKYLLGFCPIAILRFGIIYGSRSTNLSAVESLFINVKSNDEVKVGSLKTSRCFIHVSDIASGIIKSLNVPGFNVLNLEGDKRITLLEVIETSQQILDKKVKIVETSPQSANQRTVSNTKAKKLLDWQPEVNLTKGLSMLNSYVDNYHN